MRRILKTLFLIMLMVLVSAVHVPAETDDPGIPEWTVMFYMCGSDLESRHSCATGNLEEIMSCITYDTLWKAMHPDDPSENEPSVPVNVVIETGGCKEWHAQELGMDIAADRLQRWHFEPDRADGSEMESSFILDEELALSSMADPETLSDFIRWSVSAYPARKYALVLWDHGNGSKTGLFIDELFQNDTMYLNELHDALSGGGVTFEAVLLDACLMANIETACALKDHARWMIASEETVAGKGTAMGSWLQQLYYTPQWDGKMLGRWICDMTQIKYANETDEQAKNSLTWSLIDLSGIDSLLSGFDQFFEFCGRIYASDPQKMALIADFLCSAPTYGVGDDCMTDLSEIFYHPAAAGLIEPDVYNEILEALSQVIVYTTRGTGRSRSGGLAFCYATKLTADQLDIYSQNCPSAHYLAFMDAVMPGWSAPDWVYEQADRLPEITDMEVYQTNVTKTFSSLNEPSIEVQVGVSNYRMARMALYRKDERTGHTISLGCMPSYTELIEDKLLETPGFFGLWPAIEDVFCCIELVNPSYMLKALYNIPIRIDNEDCVLRCGFDPQTDDGFTIYGLWEGYDADSGVFNRNVIPLSQLAGREFTLLYPVDGTREKGQTVYDMSEMMEVYRSLEVKLQVLPEGTYYMEYWVEDMFKRDMPVGRVEVYWDTNQLTLADPDSWQGTVTLTPAIS